LGEIDDGDVVGPVQQLMDHADRPDPAEAGFEACLNLRTLGLAALEPDETADQLQVILDPVVEFLEQHLALLQRLYRHPASFQAAYRPFGGRSPVGSTLGQSD
jgi:hypothetical protein